MINQSDQFSGALRGLLSEKYKLKKMGISVETYKVALLLHCFQIELEFRNMTPSPKF